MTFSCFVSSETDPLTDAEEGKDILAISHGVALILLFSAYSIPSPCIGSTLLIARTLY